MAQQPRIPPFTSGAETRPFHDEVAELQQHLADHDADISAITVSSTNHELIRNFANALSQSPEARVTHFPAHGITYRFAIGNAGADTRQIVDAQRVPNIGPVHGGQPLFPMVVVEGNVQAFITAIALLNRCQIHDTGVLEATFG